MEILLFSCIQIDFYQEQSYFDNSKLLLDFIPPSVYSFIPSFLHSHAPFSFYHLFVCPFDLSSTSFCFSFVRTFACSLFCFSLILSVKFNITLSLPNESQSSFKKSHVVCALGLVVSKQIRCRISFFPCLIYGFKKTISVVLGSEIPLSLIDNLNSVLVC